MSRIEWRSRRRTFEITDTPLVMGIVNVTPDSFSDGGRYDAPSHAIARARELVAEGADIVDLGAESTRPGSRPVPADHQLRRLLPVVEALAGNESACLSVDTASAEVADRVLAMGTDIVNDTSGLGDPAMAGVVARHGAGLVLMHIQGTPATMQADPRYEDVAREVRDHLRERIARARAAGVREEAIAVDPGIGFGKTAAHNFELLARLEELAALGRPGARLARGPAPRGRPCRHRDRRVPGREDHPHARRDRDPPRRLDRGPHPRGPREPRAVAAVKPRRDTGAGSDLGGARSRPRAGSVTPRSHRRPGSNRARSRGVAHGPERFPLRGRGHCNAERASFTVTCG